VSDFKTILISGGTGLLGNRLSKKLIERGHRVILLSRSSVQSGDIPVSFWNPSNNVIDQNAVAAADGIIHLAGTNIGSRRWTASRRKSIIESRVNTCRLLFEAVCKCSNKPELFISASGISYYGMVTSERIFTETDPAGDDFLAQTCFEWEREARTFTTLGIRTVIFRNGLVLTRQGGIISRLYAFFRAGIGAVLGSGRQYVPWIHIDDLCKMYIMAVENGEMSGVYNAVAPEFLTFSDFAHQYASSLNRKIILPSIPPLALKLAFGEMSGIILEGSRISCSKIQETGFIFKYNSLLPALEDLFKTQQ